MGEVRAGLVPCRRDADELEKEPVVGRALPRKEVFNIFEHAVKVGEQVACFLYSRAQIARVVWGLLRANGVVGVQEELGRLVPGRGDVFDKIGKGLADRYEGGPDVWKGRVCGGFGDDIVYGVVE